MDGQLLALFWAAFPFLALGLLVYAIRRGARMQQVMLKRYDESRKVQDEMKDRQQRLLELTEENVELQHDIHALLERAVNALERRV